MRISIRFAAVGRGLRLLVFSSIRSSRNRSKSITASSKIRAPRLRGGSWRRSYPRALRSLRAIVVGYDLLRWPPTSAEHEYRAGSVVDDGLRDAAQNEPLYQPRIPAADHYQVRVDLFCQVQDLLSYRSFSEVGLGTRSGAY